MEPHLAAQAEQLAARGQIRQALALLQPLAERGDGDALFTLAIWLLEGRYLVRDLSASRAMFGRATRAGQAEAAAIEAAFLANGTGGPADWTGAVERLQRLAPSDPAARDQLSIIRHMDLAPDGSPRSTPELESLSDRPRIHVARSLFTAAECDFLMRSAEPLLGPAVVIDPQSGRAVQDPVRTSDGAAFPLALENPAIHALNRRIAAITGTAAAQGEPLNILSYAIGQQYRAHVDALANVDNQRVLTVLVYLNVDYAGGETRFLPDGPVFRGAKGDAIVFRNVDAAGRPDPSSRHAGLPVTSGRKLIASRWIRERPLDLGDRRQKRA